MSSSRNIYVLLTGINNYDPDSGVKDLQGCIQDIQIVEQYLRDRISPEKLHLLSLFNEHATRQAVVDAFRNHLCKAGSEDTVLFYFAGHGSQEDAPEEFWAHEPDHLNETLVLYDSRSENGLDLADKDLAALIGEVAVKNPHIALILDCCHSGSGTRNLDEEKGVRRVPKCDRRRPLKSYLIETNEMDSLKPISRNPDRKPSGWYLPQGRHVLMSACREHETAKECPIGDGQIRGIFSRFLLESLARSNGKLSYRELFQQTNALVRSNIAAQSPQLESTHPEDMDLPFLGIGTVAPRENYFTVSNNSELGWVVNGGALHGITSPTNGETTLLALFPFSFGSQKIRSLDQIPKPIGDAEVTAVHPQLSQIQSSVLDKLDHKITLKAVVTSQPLSAIGVMLIADTPGDEIGIDLFRSSLQKVGDNQVPSLYVVEEHDPYKAALQLLARDQEYIVTRPTDDRLLMAPIQGYTSAKATEVIRKLEHIARWQKVVELNSPSNSRLATDAIRVEILQGRGVKDSAQVINAPQIRLEYQHNAGTGEWVEPTFRIRLTNQSTETLYCALLDLTEQFEIDASGLPGGTVRLKSGHTAWVNNGQPLFGIVPERLWNEGVTEYQDILKVIACTTDFDATLIEQDDLEHSLPPTERSASRGSGTLNRLLQRVITRQISNKRENEEICDDWVATQVTFTFVRPQSATEISKYDAVGLGMKGRVSLQPHQSLKTKARLTTINQSARDLGNHIIPPILRSDSSVVQPFEFTANRGSDPGLHVLQLTDIRESTHQSVTPEHPLKLTIKDMSLQNGEQLLAVAYDGEFFLPVGIGRNIERDLEISLERLPNPIHQGESSLEYLPGQVDVGERSLVGSIQIFFQKVICNKLKFDFPYPLLSAVHVQPDCSVDPYDTDEVSVKEQVAQANRIVLFVHGIIGDTVSMVPSVQQAKVEMNKILVPLFHPNVYDLVLAFDYENLNTSIENNAQFLKQKLEAVGLKKGHDKTLHIIAHSMGGLVSRWFIEREGGNDIVKHLIMFGTPNNGSPWPNVLDVVLPLLTIGLNGLASVSWPVKAIGGLMRLAGATTAGADRYMTTTLKEMQPKSSFIESLYSSEPPGIPYTIIPGNTSLIQPKDLASQAKIQKLLQQIGTFVIEAPFMGMSNDIAVTVNSITHLPKWSPAPTIIPTACDHLTYFSNPNGLAALGNAVSNALREQ